MDVIILDKKNNDLLIIEVKNHIAKLRMDKVIKQGYLEKDILEKKGKPVEQLERQKNWLEMVLF
ncbi:NERD domain-containing protein [Tepidibacter sp.]|uniref:NERD domain-containing protein n=1 Tax=Tepidibacter sp. TaxID=2529387 RepID=UPI002ED449D4